MDETINVNKVHTVTCAQLIPRCLSCACVPRLHAPPHVRIPVTHTCAGCPTPNNTHNWAAVPPEWGESVTVCRRAASEDESGHSRRADGTQRAHMDSHHERVMTKTNLSGWFMLEAVGLFFFCSRCVTCGIFFFLILDSEDQQFFVMKRKTFPPICTHFWVWIFVIRKGQWELESAYRSSSKGREFPLWSSDVTPANVLSLYRQFINFIKLLPDV